MLLGLNKPHTLVYPTSTLYSTLTFPLSYLEVRFQGREYTWEVHPWGVETEVESQDNQNKKNK